MCKVTVSRMCERYAQTVLTFRISLVKGSGAFVGLSLKKPMAMFLLSVSFKHLFGSCKLPVIRLKYTKICKQHFPAFIRMLLIVVIGRHMIKWCFTIGCYFLCAVLRVKGWLYLRALLCVAPLMADKCH